MSTWRFRVFTGLLVSTVAAMAWAGPDRAPAAFQNKFIADLVKELAKGSPNRGAEFPYTWGVGLPGDVAAGRLLAIGKPVVPALTAAMQSGSRWQRIFAMEILSRLKVREAIPAMLRVLVNDKDPALRDRAAECLGDLRAKEALPTLIKAAYGKLAGQGKYTAGWAANALGKIGDPSAVPALESRLGATTHGIPSGIETNDPTAALALAALGEGGIPSLERAVAGTDDNAMISAVEALAKMRDSRATTILVGALERRPIRREVVYALGRNDDPQVIAALVPLLKAEDLDIVAASATVLARMGARESATDIRAAVARLPEGDGFHRGSLLKALCDLKDKDSVPLLLAEVQSGTDQWRRYDCANAISQILGAEAVPMLVGLLPKREHACAPALARLGMPAVRAVLQARKRGEITDGAVGAVLCEVQSPDALRPALGLLRNPQGDALDGLLSALRDVPLPEAREGIARHLHDDKPPIRLHAAQALGRLGDPRAIPVLIEDLTLKLREPQRSGRTFQWLGKPAVPALERAISRTAPELRDGLVHALIATASPAAAKALIAEARNPDNKDRICAIRGLRGIGSAAAIREVRAHAVDNDVDIRWEVFLTYVPSAESRLPKAQSYAGG